MIINLTNLKVIKSLFILSLLEKEIGDDKPEYH